MTPENAEDGDIGYHGTSHASFVAHMPASVAHIRATSTGSAAIAGIKAMLSARKNSRVSAEKGSSLSVDTGSFQQARERVLRGA
jgi:hypothetical protein